MNMVMATGCGGLRRRRHGCGLLRAVADVPSPDVWGERSSVWRPSAETISPGGHPAATARTRTVQAISGWMRAKLPAWGAGCVLVVSGCVGSPRAPVSEDYASGDSRPEIVVTYHPYGPSQLRHLAQPTPDYSGWTDGRMDRDIRRMADAGVDVLALVLDVSTEIDDRMQSRLTRFMAMGAELHASSSGPRLAFWLTSSAVQPTDAATAAAFLAWLAGRDPHLRSWWYQLAEMPVVVLAPELSTISVRHPALRMVRTALPPSQGGVDWAWWDGRRQEPPSPNLLANAAQTQVAVRGGADTADRGWGGTSRARAFRASLRAAFAMRPQHIVVASWNDFGAGDFIEPNRVDGDSLLKVLTEETARRRALTAPPAP